MNGETSITFFGTNCLVFTKAGSALMVDPHFTRPNLLSLFGKIAPDPEKIAAGLIKAGVDSLAGVLLTHAHYDHALDAVETVRRTDAMLYGSASAGMLASGEGLEPGRMRVVMPGEAIQIDSFRVRFIPSRHVQFPVPLRWFMSDDEVHSPASETAGLVLAVPVRTGVRHSGGQDTGIRECEFCHGGLCRVGCGYRCFRDRWPWTETQRISE